MKIWGGWGQKWTRKYVPLNVGAAGKMGLEFGGVNRHNDEERWKGCFTDVDDGKLLNLNENYIGGLFRAGRTPEAATDFGLGQNTSGSKSLREEILHPWQTARRTKTQ